MPIGKLDVSDRHRLDDHFWKIVGKACLRNKCWRGEVLNRGFKGPAIAQARTEIVREIRDTAFTYYVGNGWSRLVLDYDEAGPGFENLKPVSFPLLGRMLGLDHSTLILGQVRLKEQEKANGNATT